MVYDTAIKMSNDMASPITYENISTPKKGKMVILTLKVSSFLKCSKCPNSKFPILSCKIAKNV